MRMTVMIGLVACATPAMAQSADDPAPTIQVVGSATVLTPPDRATMIYWVTGEGKTADDAATALATKHKAIVGGLSALLGRDTQLSAGEVSVMEVRAPECDGPGNYNNRPRLSVGVCAVTGYIATLQGTGRTTAIDKAATATGLAVRLGARDARVQGFQLRDPAAAQRRAAAAAIADARVKAAAMAAGAGVRLGDLVTLNDQNNSGSYATARAEDIGAMPGVAMQRLSAPPVEIGITPQPIETQARIFARFAIAR